MPGMEVATWAVLIAAGMFGLHLVVQLVGGGWNLSSRLSQMETALRKAIEDSKSEVEARQDKSVKDFGETASALREKIREVELFCRDTFMRRDSFYEVNKANSEALNSLGSEIKARLERMEAKIDAQR
jgi:hypothetical protein